MTAISKNFLYGIQTEVFYSIKPMIYILEYSKDDETRLKLLQSYPITQQFLFDEDFHKSFRKSHQRITNNYFF